jgi:hypothetical protein
MSLSEMDQTLLAMLAKQTGADLHKLTRDYQKGDLSSLLAALPQEKRSAVQQIIRDPAAAAKAKAFAESDQAKKNLGFKG